MNFQNLRPSEDEMVRDRKMDDKIVHVSTDNESGFTRLRIGHANYTVGQNGMLQLRLVKDHETGKIRYIFESRNRDNPIWGNVHIELDMVKQPDGEYAFVMAKPSDSDTEALRLYNSIERPYAGD